MVAKKAAKNSKAKSNKRAGFFIRHRKLVLWLTGIVGAVLVLMLAIYIFAQISPWPKALFFRYEMTKMSDQLADITKKYVPAGITSVDNQQYRPNDQDGYLDVFYPEGITTVRPTVIWVHGGAWISGDKNEVDSYLKVLASRGYTTVGVDYTVAPERQYPFPLVQLNDALKYIQQNADRLHIDKNSIVLAGDSAGSQIVAQMANIITSHSYAKEVGITPALSADKLKGMLLNCGAYDLALPDYSGPFGDFLHTVLWAYSGEKDFIDDPKLKHASVVNYVTKAFPPSFITAGNGDPLEPQSKEMAQKLTSLGVSVEILFYPATHSPSLPHEYQFNLDTADGKQALNRITEFLSTTMQ
ncbi:MAG TPA: alpha/beta hydrolase [Candidatus Saccharimonadales bacterium]